jgi:hypothetical protein
MGCLEGGEVPVLYIGRTVPKGYTPTFSLYSFYSSFYIAPFLIFLSSTSSCFHCRLSKNLVTNKSKGIETRCGLFGSTVPTVLTQETLSCPGKRPTVLFETWRSMLFIPRTIGNSVQTNRTQNCSHDIYIAL